MAWLSPLNISHITQELLDFSNIFHKKCLLKLYENNLHWRNCWGQSKITLSPWGLFDDASSSGKILTTFDIFMFLTSLIAPPRIGYVSYLVGEYSIDLTDVCFVPSLFFLHWARGLPVCLSNQTVLAPFLKMSLPILFTSLLLVYVNIVAISTL